MARKLIWCLTAVLSIATTATYGQEGVLEELYGRGVHAFFAGNLGVAYDSLTATITNGSRDPRAYYFRGLVLNGMGRTDEACTDFLTGAQLEAVGGVAYPVGRALERIQGPERILVETYRRNARVANYSTQSTRDRLRYEEFRRNEAETLRGAPRIAPPAAQPPGRPDAGDPFSGPPATLPAPAPGRAPVPMAPAPASPPPAAVPPPPAPDPFATPPAEAPVPAAPRPAPPAPAPAPPADPFATPPPAAPAPAAPAPAAPPADPFATPPPTAP
jgi:hypothetical protein